jgi:hypothetical protein
VCTLALMLCWSGATELQFLLKEITVTYVTALPSHQISFQYYVPLLSLRFSRWRRSYELLRRENSLIDEISSSHGGEYDVQSSDVRWKIFP